MMRIAKTIAVACTLSLGFCAVGADSNGAQAAGSGVPTAVGIEFFEKRVRPILASACYSCHSHESDKVKGGLYLDSREGFLKGGESGPLVDPATPGMGRLLESVKRGNPDLQMPPKKALRPEQVDDLETWVRMGSPWPVEAPAVSSRKRGFEITESHRQHWSFRPLHRPQPPRSAKWGNPVDAFIEAHLASKQLEPSGRASRSELIRRVYFDLIGLPPSPEEVETFVHDDSPTAWERLVDRLLASSHYGEKWGRFWLDLVRFAETNSYERDGAKPHAWRYRDYVIRSFNEDKPYDRFIREQLAGDELPDAGDEGWVATGYLRLGIWDDEPADRELARYDMLDDIVATTGQVFLGLTVDCARCHDHKIDPIGQRDYYSMLAFFQNVNHYKNGGPTDEVELGSAGIEPENFETKVAGAKPPVRKALVVTEKAGDPAETHVLLRGSPENKGEKVSPAFLQVLNPPQPVIQTPASGKSSGRRLALADWIASPSNPLTARVMANRVWQFHFGRGLVRTPSDFGMQGMAPTHPELLDWLACELVESGWSLKRLHRRILLSSAYQRSSRPSPKALEKDPANDGLSHFDMRRLTAEEIRDAILQITGPLNSRMYGPGIFVTIPKEVLAGQSVPGSGWGNSDAAEQLRRSVYIHVKRSLLAPLLLGFDLAETDRSTPVRFSTTQPTQALGMLNSEFLNERAVRFAERVAHDVGNDPRRQVRRILALVTSREPSETEISRGIGLLERLTQEDRLTQQTALSSLCLMALNLNEFLYLD